MPIAIAERRRDNDSPPHRSRPIARDRISPRLAATETAKSVRAREIGLGIIGSGRIGTLRGRLAGEHPGRPHDAIVAAFSYHAY
jgi:hypothetical protein